MSAAAAAERDLYVVSDLHVGRGLDPATRRHSRLEAFLYDEDFFDFCHHLCLDSREHGARALLVLNGDTFDFLRVEPGEATRRAGPLERRFGPVPTPEVAARIARGILGGHPRFVDALCEVLSWGNEILFLPGNHDLEVQWPEVQEEVRAALRARLEARGDGASHLERVRFEPWFHYEPGRIWIEHGCQYDPENAFRFPLRRRIAAAPWAKSLYERDLPLGNFFQKYLYNAFGNITFLVPSSRANYRYFRFLLVNEPRILIRAAKSHGWFLLSLLRRLAREPQPAWLDDAAAADREEVRELGMRSGLGGRLDEVAALKFSGADAARAAAGLLRQAAKAGAAILAVTVLALLLWAAASRAIDTLTASFGLRALLSLVLYLAFGAASTAALVAAVLRMPRDESPRPIRNAAARIAALVDVPIVTFGHTHEELVQPVRSGGGWYLNTGTWIAVFTHDVLLPRERVQFTFLRVRGRDAELLHWSPARRRPVPVILLDEGGSHDGPGSGPVAGPAAADPAEAAPTARQAG